MIAAPQHIEHVTQRGLADLATHAIAINVQNLLHRFQSLAAQNLAQIVLRERNALADRLLNVLLKLRRNGFQQLLTEPGTAPAAS